MVDYRPVGEDQLRRFWEILEQAFTPERGPLEDVEQEVDVFEPRGLFDDELVAVCKRHHLEATVRGEWTTIGGVGAVATPPEHRRKGHARTLLESVLAEYRDEGVDLVTLWPFSTKFYRTLGWGTANWHRRGEAPPDQLAGLEDLGPHDGRIREVDVDDWERLRPVEVARARRFGLSVRRSEAWWRERTLAAWPPGGSAPYVYAYEVDGEVRGYVIGDVQEDGDDKRLSVPDLAGMDHDAERALLAFLGTLEPQVDTVRIEGPLADDLLELVPEPDEIDVSRMAGPMVRLTDVERGLAAIEWPPAATGELLLAVQDPLLERNDRSFSLGFEAGRATVEPASGDRTPDATVDVATLSRLAVGGIDAARAERLDGLEVHSDDAAPVLRDAFRSEPVAHLEFY